MRNKRSIIIVCIVLLALSVGIWRNKPISYLKVIDKVFQYDFSGMAVVIDKSSNLYGKNSKVYYVCAGNKDDNFSANNSDGIILKSAKELFLNLKDLKVIKEKMTHTFNETDNKYYSIQLSLDYAGKQRINIYYLNLFINTENYHIYVPKDYYEPIELMSKSVAYIEYEPNQISKDLINSIINIK